jgi:hypothetical protein
MGEAHHYGIELCCPRCGLAGNVAVSDEPAFTVEKLPPYFRLMQPSVEPHAVKLACRCGQIFDLKGQQQKL